MGIFGISADQNDDGIQFLWLPITPTTWSYDTSDDIRWQTIKNQLLTIPAHERVHSCLSELGFLALA